MNGQSRNNRKDSARSHPTQVSRRQEWIPKGSASTVVRGDSSQCNYSGDSCRNVRGDSSQGRDGGDSCHDLLSSHSQGRGKLLAKRQMGLLSNPVRKMKEGENREETGKNDMNLPQLAQEIEEKLIKGTVECMICYDIVRRSAIIWSCSSCYAIFHLNCIKKWARAPASVDLSAEKNQGFNWRCPACQGVQRTPSKDICYVCFCGKRPRPPSDLYLTPHSCGETCGKPLDKNIPDSLTVKEELCPHLCVLQCHPGPCPPCKAFAPPRPCPCWKKIITTRCSDRKSVPTCGQQCNKLLDCGRHHCEWICHTGPCKTCDVFLDSCCFCKKTVKAVCCGMIGVKGEVELKNGVFSCNTICGSKLSCGNHECGGLCHPGPCGECDSMPSRIKTCYCGKTALLEERESCLDPIPTCSQICGRLLPCGMHHCKDLCHQGDCAPCSVPVMQKCRCKSTSRTVECYKTMMDEGRFTCEKLCGQKKSCGRHRCSERCCPLSCPGYSHSGDWDPHLCSMACGKRLRCGQHSCESLCHIGHCPPCRETIFTDLTCACGRMVMPPPLPCGTPPPSCEYPCLVAQPCGHAASHSCHFGDCPPCSIPVAKECVGGHVVLRNIPCGSRDIRCNKMCGKTRQCGMHACARTCHPPPCDSNSETLPASRTSCGQACGAPRRDCRHTCTTLCHPSSPCPNLRCDFPVTISCSCGRLTAKVPCDEGGPGAGDTVLEASVVLKLPVPLQPADTNGKKIPLGQRKLLCDDACAKMERRRVLADAFDVTPPSLDALHHGEDLAISDLFHRDPKWVLSVEERCKFLVMGKNRGSSTGLRVHVFCPMLKEKRDAASLIAERWKLSVNRAGWEPKRFIIVHVTSKSKAPGRVLGTRGSVLSNLSNPPPFDPLMDTDPRLVVALLDLPGDSDVSALVLRFGGECELVWLNDRNALAVFGDRARAATALRRLDNGSVYHGACMMVQSDGVVAVQSKASLVSGSKAWKQALVQDPGWTGGSWGKEEWSAASEASTAAGTVVGNRWNALDSEALVVSSSPSAGVDVDPGNHIAVAGDGNQCEVVENWEEACAGD